MTARPRVVVIGDVLADTDVDGTATRLCPDAPAPVLDSPTVRRGPGGAGVAALMAARLGADVVLVTALGDDARGVRLRARLEDHAADGRLRVIDLPLRGTTPSKTRILASGRVVARVDVGDGRYAGDPDPRVADALRDCDAVLVADYGRGVAAAEWLRGVLASAAGRVPVVWDPHPRGAVPVRGVAVATPNADEAARVHRGVGHQRGLGLLAAWRCSAVAVTEGPDGALLTRRGDVESTRIAVHTDGATVGHDLRDTCGAGDVFSAAVAVGLAGGSDAAGAVRLGVDSAAAMIADGGTRSLWETHHEPTVRPARPRTVPPAQRPGRLVATGGCFDLLHAGHVALLQRARALGDALVVCLNSDESVRRLKGAGRPIVGVADRERVLRELRSVDDVVVFDEDTPVDVIRRLRPDVWVKGDDRDLHDLPESALVHALGGEVVLLSSLPDHSTTALTAAASRAWDVGRPTRDALERSPA